MEAPQLRLLGVGDIVDRVFALYRGRPGLFLALAAIPYLIFFLIIGVLGIAFAATFVTLGTFAELASATPSAAGLTPALVDALVAALAFGLIVILVAIVIFSAQSAALVEVAAARHLGRDITLGDAFRTGLRKAPRVIGAGFLAFFALLVVWVVLAIAMAISNNGWVVFVGVVGGLVFTVYAGVAWIVAPAVATLEPVGALQALRRSWFLATGNRWRIIGLQLLLLILNVVLTALFSLVFLSELIGEPTVRFVLQQAVTIAANIAWAPIQWATVAVLYFDLRVRKEALDLQLAAEALPREA
ncbi:MAG TPA: hypothetical protein VMQ78_01790 [Candidatus Limnocylindria bacterium]|nr:hypothetical protein [Candidatus Limnocylindria bacterium]